LRIIIMAGGRGSRMGFVEKPLIEVCGRRMLDAALSAASALGEPLICVSSSTAAARLYCGDNDCVVGSGSYVSDLNEALEAAGLPALVIPADMPFLDRGLHEVARFVGLALGSRARVATLNTCRRGRCSATGISLFKSREGDWEDIYMLWRSALMDVDYPEDLEEAASLCATMEEGGTGWTSAST
jgi:adenosylcobinamide-phosphate guanylyltransferase